MTDVPGRGPADPGRVSPEDLEAMERVRGCGTVLATGVVEGHYAALIYAEECLDCRRLLYLAIASRVESATIENAEAFLLGAAYGQKPEHVAGALSMAHIIPRLPRLYAPPTPTQEGT